MVSTVAEADRCAQLMAEIAELLEYEDNAKNRPSQNTPRRLFRAALSIQVARAVASMSGGQIKMDEDEVIHRSFWHICPPSDR